jgi:biopolymer transport protein TolR
MGMDTGGGRGGPKSEINVTPFVDVVLVLLIIFMVLTPLVIKEIDVSIPRKADEEVTADIAAQQVILHVKKGGQISLADLPVVESKLASRVHSIFAQREKKVLFVRIDDDANYGLAVKLMDISRGAGVKTLGMVTR